MLLSSHHSILSMSSVFYQNADSSQTRGDWKFTLEIGLGPEEAQECQQQRKKKIFLLSFDLFPVNVDSSFQWYLLVPHWWKGVCRIREMASFPGLRPECRDVDKTSPLQRRLWNEFMRKKTKESFLWRKGISLRLPGSHWIWIRCSAVPYHFILSFNDIFLSLF